MPLIGPAQLLYWSFVRITAGEKVDKKEVEIAAQIAIVFLCAFYAIFGRGPLQGRIASMAIRSASGNVEEIGFIIAQRSPAVDHPHGSNIFELSCAQSIVAVENRVLDFLCLRRTIELPLALAEEEVSNPASRN